MVRYHYFGGDPHPYIDWSLLEAVKGVPLDLYTALGSLLDDHIYEIMNRPMGDVHRR